ncbi:ABC transporter ATP-binding protein [Salimicrobium flavidum]|uniref:ABC-2 type transport system ATP-binding protein n=1 Tax=Salimicrobium flavidum TaxID=570947 RepID=A0A1N7K8P6_9BACI|nr:ABC transporter ATP-binding protein [Salimicrobium flavidum]SIS57930.1 ABC-2 type transport system ATP-binding protein [Salimicrobium flavidum]
MIEVRNAMKTFQSETVIRDVSLSVRNGSIYGLLGSNGAGKTTLLRMMAGILRTNSGEMKIDGEDIFENNRLKETMIFLQDDLYFFSQYTPKQMARFYRETYPSWDEERYAGMKQSLGLDENKKINKFSKGMKRQVAFWLALSAKPEVMILDEPFDGLDAVVRKTIKSMILEDVAERSMTVIISSHNLKEVEDICDYIGILHNGTILLERDIDDLKGEFHKVQAAFRKGKEPDMSPLDVVHREKRGSVFIYIVRGEKDEITSHVQAAHPVVFDQLSLTLEEIFIYEMRRVGYAKDDII